MNELDYTTLEVSKRLMEAGIKLETDAVWFESLTGWIIAPLSNRYEESIPAYSFTTLWRELPEKFEGYYFKGEKDTQILAISGEVQEISIFGYYNVLRGIWEHWCSDINPADALAELYIWVTERKEKKV